MNLPKVALLALMLFFAAGCEDGNEFQSIERNTVNPLPAIGFELYSWNANNKQYYTLVTTTNRIKSREEIMSKVSFEEEFYIRYTTDNLDELIQTLTRIPENQSVVWSAPKGFSRPMIGVIKVTQVCEKLKIDLSIIEGGFIL